MPSRDFCRGLWHHRGVDILATVTVGDLPGQLWTIFYRIVLPMLLLAGAGYLIQRAAGLDLRTLTRLNFYFVMPGIIYYSLVTSRLTAGRVLTVIAFTACLLAAMAGLTLLVAVLRRVPARQRHAMVLTTILYNSGNFGLPLQERAFAAAGRGAAAMAIQAIVMICQNIFTFTVGVFVAAAGQNRHWKDNLLHIVKLPPLWTVAAAVITVQIRNALGDAAPRVAEDLAPLWNALLYAKDAFIGVALLTLGAQLANVRRGHAKYPVRWSVLLRLLCGPAIAVGLIYLFGLRGFFAQVLLIGSSSPTAVNCMLLCLEFNNHPDYAATAVFYSTLLSPLTVTGVVFLAQGNLLPGLAI